MSLADLKVSLVRERAEYQEVWRLIKGEHAALLVTRGDDGSLDSRPMGCLQETFEGTLWFATFKSSLKLQEIEANPQVLVSYARPSNHEYVSITGRARVVDDPDKIKKYWREALRVWFPKGAEDPDLILIAVDAEGAKYWIKGASLFQYAWTYIKTRLTGTQPSPAEVGTVKNVRF
jgi:general stress protein 26